MLPESPTNKDREVHLGIQPRSHIGSTEILHEVQHDWRSMQQPENDLQPFFDPF
jgi:hypothetical protein